MWFCSQQDKCSPETNGWRDQRLCSGCFVASEKSRIERIKWELIGKENCRGTESNRAMFPCGHPLELLSAPCERALITTILLNCGCSKITFFILFLIFALLHQFQIYSKLDGKKRCRKNACQKEEEERRYRQRSMTPYKRTSNLSSRYQCLSRGCH